MSIHETMMHILYSVQKDGIIEQDNRMKLDYSSIINDLIKKGLVVRVDKNLKFTESGLQKINYLREVRGLK
jgi:predicted transcriptional regulator